MAVIVQKYGGTSVGSLNRIEAVAENIIQTRQQGHQVVAVLSAMSGETNRLLSLAQSLDKHPASRELDVLLATGEQVSIALLAIALIQRGYSAISLLAHQVGIVTDNHFGRAHIKHIKTKRLAQALEQEQIVLVAGFQGVDHENNITTLGRGGSDTSAVAIAAALQANECQIFTDVDGIYSADPRIVPQAKRLDHIRFDEMLVMANLGAKVLQNRAVEYAMRHNLTIRVLSSFNQGVGTQVTNHYSEEMPPNQLPVSSITHQQQELLLTLNNIRSHQLTAEYIQALADKGIELDMLNQTVMADESITLSFTIHQDSEQQVLKILQNDISNNAGVTIKLDHNIAKLSVVGAGIKSKTETIGQFFKALSDEKIEIMLISSSEIHISVIINKQDLIKGVHALHSAFNLNLSA